tara:strand:- start:501 stop:707 length:207 start_codon:yes stop_codon:yes gene_type:complete
MDIQQNFAPLNKKNLQSIVPFSLEEKIKKFLTMEPEHLEIRNAAKTLLKLNDSNNENNAKALLILKRS